MTMTILLYGSSILFAGSLMYRCIVIDRWLAFRIRCLSDYGFAINSGKVRLYQIHEIENTPRWKPFMRKFLGLDWIRSYGPLCQYLWHFNGNADPQQDDLWRKYYEDGYLKLDPKQRRKVGRYYGRLNSHYWGNLRAAIILAGYRDIAHLVECEIEYQQILNSRSSSVMVDEYDEIMKAQALTEELISDL